MADTTRGQLWFITGSQHLYGEETLRTVAADARKIAEALDQAPQIAARVTSGPVVTTADAIREVCRRANADDSCMGLVLWMHTFSPAKMWIGGLLELQKPFVHFHTQHNRDIPWDSIDMDFMNLNQSAHGGREFGFIASRLNRQREVVVGHWSDPDVLAQLGTWTRAAIGLTETRMLKVARFGDNMRNVAVTEGDKVAAQARFGYAVDGYGVGDLVQAVNAVSDADVKNLVGEYEERYELSSELRENGDMRDSLVAQGRIELGMRAFLDAGGYRAFTTTFEDLHGLPQLPGLAVQRLMEAGYGFGAEGDWKTAALVRVMKVMGDGLDGGTSFMEDYTYHMDPSGMLVLGAHMLEVCPSIASAKPRLEIHPLSIGGKADPVRLVFGTSPAPALNATLVDLGYRFRMIVNEVDVVTPPEDLPNLPVARVLWEARPSLKRAAAAWILAGGAHHTGFSTNVTTEMLEEYAAMLGIEFLLIDSDTTMRGFRKEMRWNEAAYRVSSDGRY
ncbi:MAG: L-arabinose isomerase [Spirochaetota bacterium]